jgi:hypothetical protein
MTEAAAFVAALLDPLLPAPSGLKTWNGSDPGRRFAIHRNNMVSSLVDALAATFPVSRELVGLDFFEAMAAAWVRTCPPTSPVLGEYGGGLPDFIAGFAPAAGLPYLADVARLEWLRNAAWHAADARALDADAFRPLLAAPDRLGSLRLRLHPACRWLRSAHPVLAIWSAHQGQDVPALARIDPDRGEDVLVFRPEFEVRALTLPPGGAEFLDALRQGGPLAEAAARAGEAGQFDLGENLRGLIEHGLACAFLEPSATEL